MARTAIGSSAAHELDELYRAHAAEVYRYAYAVLGNSADAEDVTQTTFVNALRALERGERPRKPTNWLITIGHNVIRQRFRQQQSRPREVELDRDVSVVEAADDDGPSMDDLVRALQRIPPTQREALVLREMEGRSYKEISAILGVSQTTLETRIFRARRSLAEELENLVSCDRAELALSQQVDGRLSRKERKRLVAHLEECSSCARVAVLGMKRSRAFKSLAMLPLPFSLTLFKGAPTASAAIGLPTIGAATAVGTTGGVAAVGAGGLTAKIAIGLAAVAAAGGAGYEGVKAVRDPATPARPPKAAPAVVVPAPQAPASERTRPGVARDRVARAKPIAKKPDRVKPVRTKEPVRGRSATAPGHTKTVPGSKPKTGPKPRAEPPGKSGTAPGRVRSTTPKSKHQADSALRERGRAAEKTPPAKQ